MPYMPPVKFEEIFIGHLIHMNIIPRLLKNNLIIIPPPRPIGPRSVDYKGFYYYFFIPGKSTYKLSRGYNPYE
jgi:hypothetical protein